VEDYLAAGYFLAFLCCYGEEGDLYTLLTLPKTRKEGGGKDFLVYSRLAHLVKLKNDKKK
jgi:hypothetical protein